MIQDIVDKLINKIPSRIINKLIKNPTNIDIVLEGGAFNGSYLAGCFIYLKELEKRKYIKIHNLSACSVGTIISLTYFIDNIEIMSTVYDIAYKQFKKKADINIFKKMFAIIRKHMTSEILAKINNKLYITYFDVTIGKQQVISNYKNVDHLLDVIRRSCSFPYIIDKNLYYKNKYVDGLYPYLFTSSNNRILYLNLHSIHHITGLISVKNEDTNIKRILDGIISIHNFFVYKQKTDICSFVDEWSLIEYFKHYLFIIILDIFIYALHKIYIIQSIFNKSIKNNKISFLDVIHNTYNLFIKSFCI